MRRSHFARKAGKLGDQQGPLGYFLDNRVRRAVEQGRQAGMTDEDIKALSTQRLTALAERDAKADQAFAVRVAKVNELLAEQDAPRAVQPRRGVIARTVGKLGLK
jgi:hypothetical protein